MESLVTQFAADNTTGLGALGVDGKAFVIQLITFILGFLVLKKWAFGPILKVLNERRETIESGVALGEQMQKDKTELDAKVAQSLQDARRQADGIISDAQDEGRQIVAGSEDKAREKAAAIVAEAKDAIAQDTKRARKQMEAELVGLISDATETIIGEKVDAKKDAELIDRAMKESAKA